MVNNKDIDSQADELEYDSLLDYLSFKLFPIALKIGMTPEQFWEQDPELFWAYLEAYNQAQEEQAKYDNIMAHRQGLYFKMAYASCWGKEKYPLEPFKLAIDNTEESKTKEESNRKWSAYLKTAIKTSKK